MFFFFSSSPTCSVAIANKVADSTGIMHARRPAYVSGLLRLCIIWCLFVGSISYTEEVVHYHSYPYGYSNSYVSPMRGWPHSWDRVEPSRSDRPIYRRDTQVRPYTQLIKIEQEQSDPLMTISETLGALNTVGNYIVNMTRGVEISNYPSKELPSALYTISKNILGRKKCIMHSYQPVGYAGLAPG
ncbi:uncharacterized protein [Polyergus mexicanus]|uniref:uncharacterized protein n=1 Tax=Polyergus mexicanus TaxID=615972 RepID=UPI0038B6A625